jgi:N-acetylmuramoyl-L-alanine amidase
MLVPIFNFIGKEGSRMAKRITLILVSSLLLTFIPVLCCARNNPEKIKCTFQVSKETLHIDGFKDEQGLLYLPLADEGVKNLCLALGGLLTYSKESDSWHLNKDSDNTVISAAKAGECEKDIMLLDKAHNGTLLIKTEKLAELLKGNLSYDKNSDIYSIKPLIYEITAQEQNGELLLKIQATSNIKYTSAQLHGPERTIITIEDAAISSTAKIPDHPLLKGALLEGFESPACCVKLTLPVEKGCHADIQPRILPQSVVVKIAQQSEARDSAMENEVSLESIFVEDTKDSVKIKINTSSPFSYQWTRLHPPDNRFFVDFLNTSLKAEQTTFEPKNLLVQKIRAAQLQPGPDGATRLVLDLTQPALCELTTSPQNPKQLVITVKNQLIDVDRALLCGSGTTRTTAYAANGQLVVIDPGHGGSDRGAYNSNLGLAEKDVTLAISARLAEILKRRGWKVVMTRTTDRDVTYAGSPDKDELQARANVAQFSNAQLFVSVHINASVNKQANGVSTHWFKDCDRLLAQEVHCQLVDRTARRDRGTARDRFYVLRNTDMPAILVEAGFISNDDEASLLTNEEYLQRIAEAIANGMGVYMGKVMQRRYTAKSSGSSKK